MRLAAVLAAAASISVPAAAHDREDDAAWSVRDGWVYIGSDEAKGDSTFLATNRVTRIGNAAHVETLRVEAMVDERFGTNQSHYHLLVDCSDGSWTRVSYRGFRPDGSGSRLIERPLGPRAPLDSTTSLGKALALACRGEFEGLEIVADPLVFVAKLTE